MNKLQAILAIANAWESTGKAFFNRNSDRSMVIWIRDPRLWGGNPNREHWANARAIETAVHAVTKHTSCIEVDRQSGNLRFQIYNIYPKNGE